MKDILAQRRQARHQQPAPASNGKPVKKGKRAPRPEADKEAAITHACKHRSTVGWLASYP